jgi:hypothetical protein
MGTVIEFPQRGGTEVPHFDEKHPATTFTELSLKLSVALTYVKALPRAPRNHEVE